MSCAHHHHIVIVYPWLMARSCALSCSENAQPTRVVDAAMVTLLLPHQLCHTLTVTAAANSLQPLRGIQCNHPHRRRSVTPCSHRIPPPSLRHYVSAPCQRHSMLAFHLTDTHDTPVRYTSTQRPTQRSAGSTLSWLAMSPGSGASRGQPQFAASSWVRLRLRLRFQSVSSRAHS